MLSTLAVSGYTLPVPDLPVAARVAPRERGTGTIGKLAHFAEMTAKRRALLKEQTDRFEALFRQANALDISPDELDNLADALLVKEQEVASLLVPRIEKLRATLAEPKAHADTPTMRAWRRSAEDALEVSISWLEEYQNLRIRLIKLAADRLGTNAPSSPVFSDAQAAVEYLRGRGR